ncbi:hypothetical protein L3Q65_19455 [Amycolatopsis sp. FU40]|uniref:hypothetical protein n=1 Tax=Amycolatopsis sp. FU40 TaxID=2914159 RepID=UPI001F3A63CA|nr:hypothetical protein [Amycolatopsis sp. FU40]UKD58812.1 hypothetical protein L3Q65_19455 [Amycolatopsis sp. FU40]
MPDLKPRPRYHTDAFTDPASVAERLKEAAEKDGPTDYANRINLELLAQLVAIRRHTLIIATIVVMWAVLTAIGVIVIMNKLPSTGSAVSHY